MRERVVAVARGLVIIAQYPDCDICAEHDVIYARTGEKLHDDHIRELVELNWIWSDDDDGWKYYV